MIGPGMLSSSLAQGIFGTCTADLDLRHHGHLGAVGELELPRRQLDRALTACRSGCAIRPSNLASSSRRRAGSSLPSRARPRFRPRTGSLATASCSRFRPVTSRLPLNASWCRRQAQVERGVDVRGLCGSRMDGGSTSRIRSSEKRAARRAMAIASGCPSTRRLHLAGGGPQRLARAAVAALEGDAPAPAAAAALPPASPVGSMVPLMPVRPRLGSGCDVAARHLQRRLGQRAQPLQRHAQPQPAGPELRVVFAARAPARCRRTPCSRPAPPCRAPGRPTGPRPPPPPPGGRRGLAPFPGAATPSGCAGCSCRPPPPAPGFGSKRFRMALMLSRGPPRSISMRAPSISTRPAPQAAENGRCTSSITATGVRSAVGDAHVVQGQRATAPPAPCRRRPPRPAAGPAPPCARRAPSAPAHQRNETAATSTTAATTHTRRSIRQRRLRRGCWPRYMRARQYTRRDRASGVGPSAAPPRNLAYGTFATTRPAPARRCPPPPAARRRSSCGRGAGGT